MVGDGLRALAVIAAGWLAPGLGAICGRPAGAAWSAAELAATFGMWMVMLGAMMGPVVLPWLLAIRRQGGRTAFFLMGYAAVWSAFGLAATALQWGLARGGILVAGRFLAHPLAAGAALALVGLYQWTPLKQACLTHCASPASFLLTRWRDGWRGAVVMGAEHGLYCVGCCWLLMALMLVAGAMSLPWMVAVGLLVLAEMYVAHLAWLTRAVGALLVLGGGLLPLAF